MWLAAGSSELGPRTRPIPVGAHCLIEKWKCRSSLLFLFTFSQSTVSIFPRDAYKTLSWPFLIRFVAGISSHC